MNGSQGHFLQKHKYIGRGANQISSKHLIELFRGKKRVFSLFYRKLNLFEDLKTIFKT